jgi:hypothetical protein
VRRDLTEEPEAPRLVAALLLLPGKVAGALGHRNCVVPSAGQEVRLPEVGQQERMVGNARRRGVGQRLLQEGQALGEAAGQRTYAG